MSFVPTPLQANAASASHDASKSTVNTATAASAAAEAAAAETSDAEFVFKTRTFDLYWVDKTALMYKDGIAKTFDKDTRKTSIAIKRKSSIPIILRDMAPPSGSIFDPARKWEERKEEQQSAKQKQDEVDEAEAAKNSKKKSGKKNVKKQSAAESIKESNAADKDKKEHQRDLMKLSNLRNLKALQDAVCETTSGKINRMLKMLHLAYSDLKQGSVDSSEAEVLDILWALEEMPVFKSADKELTAEKTSKKDIKEQEKLEKKNAAKSSKKDKKSSKKDSKKEKESKEKDTKEKKEKIVLSPEAQALKTLFKEGADNRGSYKDSLKYGRKLMNGKSDLISFQLIQMADRLPPLSRYNRQFKLEDWQCAILGAIDDRRSAVVAAPTSSGKTLLSTYTCKNTTGTVLFVLPSEVLVWQIAATYYEFFRGNVTICTDQITFQEVTGTSQVYVGTPCALEKSLTKARGVAGQEMTRGEREFMILDGGYDQFDYLVLDEVHTLNGPEGDALQRIIKACTCPFLALSATIGNSTQLKSWLEKVKHEQVIATQIDVPEKPEEVILQEYFARFINLQRYVVTESEGKNGKKIKLVKLHPVAAMTPKRLHEEPDLISALSMTPTDMMDLWKRMKAIFPSTVLEDLDDPDNFFSSKVDDSKRITLTQTKDYENHLKARLTVLSKSHKDLYEKVRLSQLPPPLEAKSDVSDILYETVNKLKDNDLLPAVAFQLDTYGAFNMFKSLLARLESEQVSEFPSYRKDLIKLARDKAAMRKVAAGNSSRENAAEMEEDAQSGFTDESLISEDTTKPHDKYVLSSAGKRLSYNEVEDIIADMKKSGEKVDVNHALIRGLRRGMAIYTNEVGFSCYRRQVQMLAQKGRIAVVFSDAALAYGVNMPFRSCVFCGDMGDALTPLIAQQMQGRAGRRGMDVQGNVIYLGMDWSYIENLMLGQISHVTGKEPRYPIMALQGALSASNNQFDAKHFIHEENEAGPAFANAVKKRNKLTSSQLTVSEDMMERMCNTTMEEFCEGKESDDYLAISRKIISGLGYTNSDTTLAMDHNVLTMTWELHEYGPECVHMCAILEQLYMRFCYNKTKSFKESDATQNDFLSVLLHVVDRVPAKEGEESLQQMLRVITANDGKTLNENAIGLWLETENILVEQKEKIDGLDIPQQEKDKMNLIIPPAVDGAQNEARFGYPLDRGVYEMIILKQKGFRDDQSNERRNELKERIVRFGQICMIAHNNIQQPHGNYNALEVHFRRMFNNIKYSVADMMSQLTDQDDLTEV